MQQANDDIKADDHTFLDIVADPGASADLEYVTKDLNEER
jgi:hypothetical protein